MDLAPAVAGLASSDDPYPTYAALRRHAPRPGPDGWVVARPDDVAAALAHPSLTVAPPPAAGPAAEWQRRMARFTDGPAHGPRRAATVAVLTRLDAADVAATVRRIAAGHAGDDVVAVARHAVVAGLAAALGLAPGEAAEAASATRALTSALAPSLTPPDPATVTAGDRAADRLATFLAPTTPPAGGWDDAVAAAMAVLFQACDAAAGLVGNAAVAWARAPAGPPGTDPTPAALVRRTLVVDPPVHWTRRIAAADLVLAGRRVPASAPVWLLLVAAPFGAGPHRCPGDGLAATLAAAVLAGLAERHGGTGRPVLPAGGTGGETGRPAYEPRPNLRIPVGITLAPR